MALKLSAYANDAGHRAHGLAPAEIPRLSVSLWAQPPLRPATGRLAAAPPR